MALRGRVLALVAAAAVLAALAATAIAGVRAPVIVHDPKGDAGTGKLDLARASLGIGDDGRLRASVTMTGPWSPRDLLASDGPPGTVCVRIWLAGRTPAASPPDYLACATVAADNEKLKGSVMKERAGDLPERVASAAAEKVSARTAILRFGQSTIGRPAALRFAVEALPAGCSALACRDTAPDGQKSARLVLRSSS